MIKILTQAKHTAFKIPKIQLMDGIELLNTYANIESFSNHIDKKSQITTKNTPDKAISRYSVCQILR